MCMGRGTKSAMLIDLCIENVIGAHDKKVCWVICFATYFDPAFSMYAI